MGYECKLEMMRFHYYPRLYQLKTLSSWFCNLSAGWVASAFFVKEAILLTGSIAGSIMSLIAALYIEKQIEDYDNH